MFLRLFIYTTLFSLFNAGFAFAQNNINACVMETDDQETSIYFSSGVNTEPFQTDNQTRAIEAVYQQSLNSRRDNLTEFADEQYIFLPAFNATQGLATDVIQVLQQRADELGISDDGLTGYEIFTWINDGLNSEEVRQRISISASIVFRSTLSGLITDQVLEELGESGVQASANALRDRNVVDRNHFENYTSDLSAGRRVIIIAHSQGNLFTNEAVSRVISSTPQNRDSIAIMAIATPASNTILPQPEGFYVTANDDRVINALRLVEGNVLTGNLDNDPGILGDDRDFLNHYFDRSYFDNQLNSRPLIDTELFRLADQLPYPQTTAGEGAIRATLTWGNQPDMDLHVFEPNDEQVFFGNRNGAFGTLDMDDVNGFGPENYFVPCENAVEGTWRVGVNYFTGSAPETGTISLFLGNGQIVSPRSVTLQMGTGGNVPPTILFEVTLSVDENSNEVIYTIQ